MRIHPRTTIREYPVVRNVGKLACHAMSSEFRISGASTVRHLYLRDAGSAMFSLQSWQTIGDEHASAHNRQATLPHRHVTNASPPPPAVHSGCHITIGRLPHTTATNLPVLPSPDPGQAGRNTARQPSIVSHLLAGCCIVLPTMQRGAHPQSPHTTPMEFYQRMQTISACMLITACSTKKHQDEAKFHPDAQSTPD